MREENYRCKIELYAHVATGNRHTKAVDHKNPVLSGHRLMCK
jgi:hypothetical protein